jgi:ParB family chromosome partitioning protein
MANEMTKKRALGRGLDALLGIGADQTVQEELNGDRLKLLPIDLIQRGHYQPRIDIKAETLQELAESIKAQGVIQPIVVRPLGDGGRFELIVGERRWRAAQLAELHAIPAIVRDVPDRAAMSIAIIENIQREQLNPMEEAQAFDRLINEFEMTHQDVADAVGRSRAAVSNFLRLLELEDEVRQMLEVGDLDMGHARPLVSLSSELQKKAAHQIVARGLSVRQAERLAGELQSAKGKQKKSKAATVDPNISKLETSLAERLGAHIAIRHRKNGKGSLTIKYSSLDELEGILEHIK